MWPDMNAMRIIEAVVCRGWLWAWASFLGVRLGLAAVNTQIRENSTRKLSCHRSHRASEVNMQESVDAVGTVVKRQTFSQ